MSNAYERRGAQLNMESLYIRHDVISERKLARLNPDRPVSFLLQLQAYAARGKGLIFRKEPS